MISRGVSTGTCTPYSADTKIPGSVSPTVGNSGSKLERRSFAVAIKRSLPDLPFGMTVGTDTIKRSA
jgi:hypothetical protein